jgi:hypothetical protein
VSDSTKIIELISQNSQDCNVFTLGIGSGVSSEFIKESALKGHGIEEFVSDAKLIPEKTINLLKASLSKQYFDFKLEFDKNAISLMIPDPNKLKFLREN